MAGHQNIRELRSKLSKSTHIPTFIRNFRTINIHPAILRTKNRGHSADNLEYFCEEDIFQERCGTWETFILTNRIWTFQKISCPIYGAHSRLGSHPCLRNVENKRLSFVVIKSGNFRTVVYSAAFSEFVGMRMQELLCARGASHVKGWGVDLDSSWIPSKRASWRGKRPTRNWKGNSRGWEMIF